MDPGEHPAAAAVRETEEETGVHCEIEALVWVNVTSERKHVNGDRAQYLDHTFRCRYVSGKAHAADDESSEVRRSRIDHLPEMEAALAERIHTAVGYAGGVRLDD